MTAENISSLDAVAWEPGVAKPDPILVVDGIRRTFGGLTAVDVDHLEVQRGVITALIGPNGAGKSTTIRILLDLARVDSGRVRSLVAPLTPTMFGQSRASRAIVSTDMSTTERGGML